MQLVPLGASGPLVSRVGLGCNAFGARVDLAGARAVLDAALDAGVTHFDTADVYGGGASERFIGEVLRGRRDRVVIASKFGMPGSPGDRGTRGPVRKALEASLARLQTDYIDLYYYHRPDGVTPIAETVGVLGELAAEGKIRHVGCSNLSAAELREAVAGPVRIAALQNRYNLLDRSVEAEILPLCGEHGVGFVPHSPLANGLLTDAPRPSKLETASPEDRAQRDALAAVADAQGRTLQELAIAWLATRPGVASVIAGATSADQVRANVAAGSSGATVDELDRIAEAILPLMTAGMVIELEDVNRSEHGELYVGSRKRLATCTGVAFVDESRLLATSLVGKRMYLIRYDLATGDCEVEHEIATTFAGEEVTTDLLEFDGRDSILTSNCDLNSMSRYRLDGGELRFVEDVPIRDEGAGFCHGAAFSPSGQILCATCIDGGQNVFLIAGASGEVLYRFSHDDWIPRDACFVAEERLVVVYSRGYPGGAPDEVVRESKASLVAIDLSGETHTFLGEALIPDCQAESCVHHEGRVFVTDQLSDSVIVCGIDGDTVTPTVELPGYSFPHGIDFLPELNLLAVTNYGDNSIALRPLPDL